ncbi:MAG TPA: HlyD family efflux transporter periplasmic adaptor subunit [Burkholderiales bacterium]|nr:HlyD family efflux transporter periplasmic adaptor subunit [Burkholderiales bacterium]
MASRRFALPALLALLSACSAPEKGGWQGYIEGEFVQLASPYAGQLQQLFVHRGDQVAQGKPVFTLEQASERAARLEAEERLRSAEARLTNLRTGRRPAEIEALRAEIAQARSALALSTSQLAQQKKLFEGGFIAQARLDEAATARARDAARLAEAEAQLRTAQQPLGRDAERAAAEGEVAAARAALEQAAWRVAQKTIDAPVEGLVQDTFYTEGEWVPAGRPVAAILPPANIKARFYVPETALASVAPGRTIEIHCDGCPRSFSGQITYVSPQAEYTPPVLYSRDTRAKLLYLVEARIAFAQGAALRPGQPVDVRLK